MDEFDTIFAHIVDIVTHALGGDNILEKTHVVREGKNQEAISSGRFYTAIWAIDVVLKSNIITILYGFKHREYDLCDPNVFETIEFDMYELQKSMVRLMRTANIDGRW